MLFTIANALFPSKDITQVKSHTLRVGLLKDESELLDEVVVAVFRGRKVIQAKMLLRYPVMVLPT